MNLIEYKDIKELDELITDAELESLSCPTMECQFKSWQEVSNSVTPDRLVPLLDRIGHKLVDLKRHDKSTGIINLIYFLNTIDLSTNQPFQLVLKLLSPDERFINAKTYESGIINYLRDQVGDKIPLPKFYDCSYDATKSVIGCGYILMEKVEGQTIEERTGGDESLVPQSLKDQLIDITNAIRSVKPVNNMIGSFGEDGQIVPTYPAKALCKTFLEFFLQLIDLGIAEVNKLNSLRFLRDVLEAKKKELLDRVESSTRDLNGLNYDDPIIISHCDLHHGNVIIDPETWQVKAVIDWEWSMQIIDSLTFLYMMNFDGDSLSDMTPGQLTSFYEIYNKTEPKENIPHSLLRRFLWELGCSAAFCTSYDYIEMMIKPENSEHGANLHAKRVIVRRTNSLIKLINRWDKVMSEMSECFV